MAKIKIISNPYNREITYLSYQEQRGEWEKIKESSPDSRLREDETGKSFLPFKIKEIIDMIIDEYYVSGEAVELIFEGTKDEYAEVKAVCSKEEMQNKIALSYSNVILENARVIFEPAKDIFTKVEPIIEKIIKDDPKVQKDLNKVSDALKDIIPICVFGNYSAGKSTFINALIGSEVLPSAGDPVTAKVYKIQRSKSPDIAHIKFSYKEEVFEILFEGENIRLLSGNGNNELIEDITSAIRESRHSGMDSHINIAMGLINGYEKKDKDDIIISNVIELEIPFSRSGILGQSYNNFVIFDTPGSNSESNLEHSKVLAEALEGFSNGIPVWISTYESVDSTDNASLCEKILNIKALDERFTMIVLNKADGSDLDEGGFSKEKEQEILEYNSVEKMYASGIYFVSSIMGLGAKSEGSLTDKHYRRIYRSQQEMYSDPEDEDYATLYHYNIMPEQIKENAIEYSRQCDNLIYANSGLYCVEMEMENFASKYAAYNKCQMVYMFLKDVIEKTDEYIAVRTASLKRTREARRRELEEAKGQLLLTLGKTAHDAEYDYHKVSGGFVRSCIAKDQKYLYSVDELEEITDELSKENKQENNFSYQQRGFEEAKSTVVSHLKNSGQKLFKGGFVDSIKSMKDDLARDYSLLKEARDELERAEKEIDKETSDELMELVVREYKNNILSEKERLSAAIRENWQANALALRGILAEIVTGSDALADTQRNELSDIIINYQPLEFHDDADNVFIKTKFLRGHVLGIKINDNEKLNIRRLTNSYNDRIKKAVNEMADVMNHSCAVSFKNWIESLLTVIEENITEYNPQLKDMSEMIREETERIAELEDDQNTISTSLIAMKELMAWKVLE